MGRMKSAGQKPEDWKEHLCGCTAALGTIWAFTAFTLEIAPEIAKGLTGVGATIPGGARTLAMAGAAALGILTAWVFRTRPTDRAAHLLPAANEHKDRNR